MLRFIYVLLSIVGIELIGAFQNDNYWCWVSSQVFCLTLTVFYVFIRKNNWNRTDSLMLLIYILTYISSALLLLKKEDFSVELVGISIGAVNLIIYLIIFIQEKNLLFRSKITPNQWFQVLIPSGITLGAFSIFMLPLLPDGIFQFGILYIFIFFPLFIFANFRDTNPRSKMSVFMGIVAFSINCMIISQNEFVYKSQYGQFAESFFYGISQILIWYGMVIREDELEKPENRLN